MHITPSHPLLTPCVVALSLWAVGCVTSSDESATALPAEGAGAGGSASTAGGESSAGDSVRAVGGGGAAVVDPPVGSGGGGGDGPEPLDPNGDEDGDGVTNGEDNCPTEANGCQADKDADGIGDACDPSCEETCVGLICGDEGIVGCNCSNSCPAGYTCVTDAAHWTDTCNEQRHRVCAKTCSSVPDCLGYQHGYMCLNVGGGGPNSCICYTYANLPMCGGGM